MEGVYEGGCLCGAIRYRVRGNPVVSVACHCRFCQRRLGSAFATFAYFDEASVDFAGEPSEYEHRSDESGHWLRIQFCARCGTTVSHKAEGRPGQRAVALGTLDDPEAVRIERHVWLRSKRPWVSVPPEVASFPKGSAGAAAPKAP